MKFTLVNKFGLVLAALSVSASAAATVIDTTPGIRPEHAMAPFGAPNTATYGQTFTVDADNYLNAFSLYLNSKGAGTKLKGYVAAWDGQKATSILYSSDTRETGASALMQEFAFDTASLQLSAGQRYVAFLSVSGLDNANLTHSMPLHQWDTDIHVGGNMVYHNNGSDFASLMNSRWDCADSCGTPDAAFKASFSAEAAIDVPEPASLALLGLGLLGAGVARRRRA